MIDNQIDRIVLLVISYLSGSIPFGLIISRFMGGGDIRKKGSGNIGATNVMRTVGKLGGLLTLILDALKGIIPVLIAKSSFGITHWTLAVAGVAVIGHNYPIFLKFKGGKGVATSLGIIIALWPLVGLICAVIWIVSLIVWRYSSLAALISFAMLPIVTYIKEGYLLYAVFSLLISVMIFYRHIENIRRLIRGDEGKVGKKRNSALMMLLIFFLSGPSISNAEEMTRASILPDEVQKIWNERQVILSSSEFHTKEKFLEDVIRMKYQLGIERLDEISALLVREGYRSIDKGMSDEAFQLSQKAKEISPGYAPSYYLSASSLFSQARYMESLYEYMNGIKVALSDFWSLFNIAGRLYTIILISAGLTITTFLLVWAFRTVPVLFHTFREITADYIDRSLCPVFFCTFFMLPLMFGIGWFLMFLIVSVWMYLSRKERVIAILGIIFFLMLPKSLMYSASYLNGQNNMSLQGLLAVQKGYADQMFIEKIVKERRETESENPDLSMSVAFLMNMEGDLTETFSMLNRLISSQDDYIRLWAMNRIGNIYFRIGYYDEAIEYYKKSAEEFPDTAIPLYNLSQSYREKLMFAEAEAMYDAAKKINKEEVGKYATLAGKGAGYKVIEIPVRKNKLWDVALRPTREADLLATSILRAFIRIPPERFPFLGISIMIILTILSYMKPRTPLAYHCPKCRHVVCGWCTGSRIFGNACKICRGKEQSVNELKELDRRISFLMPGLWHIYKGWIGFGGVTSLVFFIGITGLLLVRADNKWYSTHESVGWSITIWICLIIASYLILPLHFKYIKIKFGH